MFTCVSLSSQTIEEKSTVELRVTVTGSPEPQVSWYCNDKQLFETLKVKLLSESDRVHVLHMERTTQQMSGLYRVTAVNTAGQTDHSATVTIAGNIPLQYIDTKLVLSELHIIYYVILIQFKFPDFTNKMHVEFILNEVILFTN